MKPRYKAEYNVVRGLFDYVTKKYNPIEARCVDFEITGDSEESVAKAFEALDAYMSKEGFSFSTCPTIEPEKDGQWKYYESIGVDSREEGNEVLEAYREFKKGLK